MKNGDTIHKEDFIQSIHNALQFISYYHPIDFLKSMVKAYKMEKSKPAKAAIGQILENSRLCAIGHRPICQDTGIVCAFVKVGIHMKWNDNNNMSIEEMINEGTRRAYSDNTNPLRASIVKNPLEDRKNTKDNTPAIVHISTKNSSDIDVAISAKGGGSEFKSQFTVLNPYDSLVDWVIQMIPKMGAGWCPPGILGIGIGGTSEKAMILAKESLNQNIDIHKIMKYGPKTYIEKLRLEIYEKVNKLGIGAQGLGGVTTVLDVKIKKFPTHAACLPVAMIPNCAATRHISFNLKKTGEVACFTPPSISHWPKINWKKDYSMIKKVNISKLKKNEILSWKVGENLLLSGKLLTGRDAIHKKIENIIKNKGNLPVNFQGRFIYYVGPVEKTNNEIIGPSGPTTAKRMDKYTKCMLSEKVGILGMIGKAERSDQTIRILKKHKVVYLIAVGGAAYLISKSIRSANIIAFKELGMEAIYEFEVVDMPVIVAVDSSGNSIHKNGPAFWKKELKHIPIYPYK